MKQLAVVNDKSYFKFLKKKNQLYICRDLLVPSYLQIGYHAGPHPI